MRTRVLVLACALTLAPALLASRPARADGVACINAAERAQRLRGQRRLVEARSDLLKCSSADCPRFVQTDCVHWLDEVTAALPSIVIRAVDRSGNDVVEGTLLVDGEGRGALGVSVELDPGPHTIAVGRGAERGEVKLLVAEGERNRIVLVTLAAAPKVEVPPVVSPARPVASSPPIEAPASSRIGPWPIVALGVGALGFLSFGVLQLAAQNEYDDLESSCGHACSSSEVASVRTKVIASAVGLGVGVLGVGAGAALLLLSRPDGPTVTVSPKAGGASADVLLRF